MKKVIVTYLFDGIIRESENETGILFPNGKVFVEKNELGLYNATPTAKEGIVLVNLDADDNNFLKDEDPSNIIDLILA